VKKLK